MTQDEMVGCYHRLDGHEFEQTPGDCEGWGRLACCRSWGHKESDTGQQLNNVSFTDYFKCQWTKCPVKHIAWLIGENKAL